MANNENEADNSEGRVNRDNNSISRRPVLKAMGGGLLSTALAGCSEDGSGGGDGGDGGGGDGGDGGQSTKRADDGTDLSGTKFTFWDQVYFRESRRAKQEIQTLIKEFQQETGATVDLNLQSDEQPLLDAVDKGEQPVGFSGFAHGTGQWIQADVLEPLDSYQDKFGIDLVGNIHENVTKAVEFAYRGWEGKNYHTTITADQFAPFVGRLDHYEEAGLGRDAFPPESYDELVEHANKLKNDGPGDVGYQIYGGTGDIQDVYTNQWTSAEGGAKGYYLNDDWSECIMNNDAWKKAWTQIVELYTKHGQGTQKTPTMTDESVVNLGINGKVSTCQQASMNLPVWLDRAPKLFDEGDIAWGTPFGGQTNTRGRITARGGVITKKPDKADESKWSKKQEGMAKLYGHFMDPVVQSTTFPSTGFFPSREDVWGDIDAESVEPTGTYIPTMKEMCENTQYSYPAFTKWGPLAYDETAPILQNSIKGEIDPEDALDKAQEAGQKIVDSTQFAG